METITIPIQKDQKLIQALEAMQYDNIPTNVILDKSLTGIGATYMEIKAKRNSIIIEPNVPVIKGKVQYHPECLGVYKGITEKKIEIYFQSKEFKYKKFLSTPESFFRILEVAHKLDINLFDTYFCLFDECEKIAQDYDYRETIAYPIRHFYNFKNKAFVSATPYGMANQLLEKEGFSILKVIPDNFDHKVDIELITTNVFNRTVINKVRALTESNSESIFIFYNSIRGIKTLIDTLELNPDDCTVFCSDSRVNELKTEEYKVQTEISDQTINKFNLITSRYYSAVDFNLSVCPDIVMLTNQAIAPHSRIDPLSESIQIQGRFRKTQPNGKRFNSLCHITDLMIYETLTSKEIDEKMQEWLKSVRLLKERFLQADSKIKKDALLQEYKSNPLYQYLDTPDFSKDFRINIFSLLNYYYQQRINKCYSSADGLIEYYERANYFNIKHTDAYDRSFSFYELDTPTIRIHKSIPQKEQIQAVLNTLRNDIPADEILKLHKENPDQYVNLQNTIQLVELVGMEEIREMKTFAAVEKALLLAQKFKASEELRFSTEIVSRIKVEFEPDLQKPIPITQIQERLQEIYNTYGLIKKDGKPFKVTQNTIEEYFTQKRNNTSRTYRLISLLPEFDSKINVV